MLVLLNVYVCHKSATAYEVQKFQHIHPQRYQKFGKSMGDVVLESQMPFNQNFVSQLYHTNHNKKN